MNNPVELMSLYWTHSGIFFGEGEISRFDFRDRVESAARVGFTGIGIWHADLEHTLKTRTLKEIKTILDANGMKYLELEFLTNWFLEGERKDASDKTKKLLLEASAALDAKHIKIGDFNNTPCSMPRIIEAFAGLCKEAEDYGATIGFEFMRSAMIHTLKDALTLIETAGAKNGGIIVDLAHVVDLGITYDEISHIPEHYLVSAELDDATLPGSPRHDPARIRRYCGDGDFDIKRFIQAVKTTGYSGPWAVEVFSKELTMLPLDQVNRYAFTTTMAQFAN